jgi:hypothetical protein
MTAAERAAAWARITPHLTTHNEDELAAMMLETVLELRRTRGPGPGRGPARPPRSRPAAGGRPRASWAGVALLLLGVAWASGAVIWGLLALVVPGDVPGPVPAVVLLDPAATVVCVAVGSVTLGALALALLAGSCQEPAR